MRPVLGMSSEKLASEVEAYVEELKNSSITSGIGASARSSVERKA